MSFKDSLTGVFNRSKFHQDWAGYERSSHLEMVSFDLNGSKQVNDQNGHIAEDDMIRKAAHAINHYFTNKTYRMGGDEFTVVDDVRTEDAFRAAGQAVGGVAQTWNGRGFPSPPAFPGEVPAEA